MAEEYLASNEFPGDGTTVLYNVSFKGNRPDAGSGVVPYINPADVKAQVITPATATTAEVVVDATAVYVGPNQFSVSPATPVGKITRIYRATQDEYALVGYQSLQTVGEADLDLSNKQLVFITQEAHDLAVRASADAENSATVAYSSITIANDAAADAALALSTANSANASAISAVGIAQDASTAAAAAEDHATSADNAALAAQAAADSANTNASNALTVAGNAVTTANAAAATANAIAGTANSALAAATAATVTANAAEATANAIDGKATTALADSAFAVATANTALNTANDAQDTADAIDAKAQSALDASAAAEANANGRQPVDATLTALAVLVTAANKMIYSTGVDAFALSDISAFGRALVAVADAAAGRTQLGLGTAATAATLGTVSQSGGVPTGAIIETGSNANGSWTKWADGTMICRRQELVTRTLSATSGSLGTTAGFEPKLAWPQTFAAIPSEHVDVLCAVAGAVWWGGNSVGTTSTTQDGALLSPVTRGSSNYTIVYTGIGRWF